MSSFSDRAAEEDPIDIAHLDLHMLDTFNAIGLFGEDNMSYSPKEVAHIARIAYLSAIRDVYRDPQGASAMLHRLDPNITIGFGETGMLHEEWPWTSDGE